MRAKLGLVVLVAGNGAFLLAPLGAEIARVGEAAAAGGAAPGELAALAAREGALGAANLLMVLTTIALAVLRPRRRVASA
jgi:hypothetical protein